MTIPPWPIWAGIGMLAWVIWLNRDSVHRGK